MKSPLKDKVNFASTLNAGFLSGLNIPGISSRDGSAKKS
jgi:hypothetical protein